MELEQRKHTRRMAKNDIFAALRGGFKKVGKINDISVKGLGFSYLRQAGNTDYDDRESKVDILFPESGVHLFNIPCRIVYENTIDAFIENLSVKTTRCGLHFGKLSDIQLDLLEFIITKQTEKKRPKENVALNHAFNLL
jgi:hypothetical protein